MHGALIVLDIAVVIVLLLVGLSALLWWRWWVVPRPQRRGSATVPGLQAPVEIRWCPRGIPHIQAASLEDAVAAQGFCHTQDRLWQMTLARAAATGSLSALVGARALPADRFLRRLGLGRAAAVEADRLEPAERGLLEAYARGVNAGIAVAAPRLPPEFRVLGVKPAAWRPADSLAIGKLLALDLAANLDAELARAAVLEAAPAPGEGIIGAEPRQDLAEWRTVVADALALVSAARAQLPRLGAGSNAVAIAGRASVSGAGMLASDPHLSLSLPALWHEARLQAGALDVLGAGLPGAPGIIMGHTPHLAWGMTNAYVDCQDLWYEELDPGLGRSRERAGTAPVTLIEERIEVRGGQTVVEPCRSTVRGPILAQEGTRALSLSWTALAPGHTYAALLGLWSATDLDQALSALARWHAPAQTVVLATRDGRIARQLLGTIPAPAPPAGVLPLPAWLAPPRARPALPAAALPRSVDPPEGFLVSANEPPADLPAGVRWDYPADGRARRWRDLLQAALAQGPLTPERLAALQVDVGAASAQVIAARAVACVAARTRAPRLIAALAGWDGQLTATGAGAGAAGALAVQAARVLVAPLPEGVGPLLLGRASMSPLGGSTLLLGRWTSRIAHATADDRGPGQMDLETMARVFGHADAEAVLVQACARAEADLDARCGGDPARWSWGALHRLTLCHALARGSRLRGWLFGATVLPMAGDCDTPSQCGPLAWDDADPYRADGPAVSWRQVVDLGARAQARSVLPGGQSGLPHHRHYRDQLAAWHAGRLLPHAFTPAADQRLLLTPLAS